MAGQRHFILTPIIWFSFSLLLCAQKTIGPGLSVDSTVTIVYSLVNSASIDQAKPYIDSLLKLADNPRSSLNLITELSIKNLYGRYLLIKWQNEEWPELYKWIVGHDSLCQGEKELDLLARLLNNAGIAFKRSGLLTESREAYLKASEALRKMKNPDLRVSGIVYMNTGNALKQIGEFERSISYFEQSIRYLTEQQEKSGNPDTFVRIASDKSDCLGNLGLVYQSLSNHVKAIEVFNECISLRIKYNLSVMNDTYNNLVISLIETGQLQEAVTLSEKILNTYTTGGKRDVSWALASMNLNDVRFRLSSDTSRFIREIDALNREILAKAPEAIDIFTVALQMKANVLLASGQFQQALKIWSEAYQSISNERVAILPMQVPPRIKTLKYNKLIELRNLNAQVFYIWGKAFGDTTLLKAAEDRYEQVLFLIDSLRNSLELQSSKIQVSRMQRGSYNELIELQHLIYKLTRDESYLPRIFNTMEQSKSAALWSSVRDIDFKSNSIPADEREKEQLLESSIDEIEGRIISAGTTGTADFSKQSQLQEELLIHNQRLDSLKQVFRTRYPDYYMAKFDRSTRSLQEIMLLMEPNQTLLEYSIVGNTLYVMLAGKSGARIAEAELSAESWKQIEFLLDFMKGHLESLTGPAKSRYCEAATSLYDLLIRPFESDIRDKNLLIIPDGVLSYIPFEALLSQPAETGKQDYRKLNYLIRNHTVSYSLTATILFYQPIRKREASGSILTIAPDYSFQKGTSNPYVAKFQNFLPELRGTYEESRMIRKLLGGKLLTGDDATEKAFKKYGSSYQVLHLAMHSIPDNLNSMNSCLVFTPGVDRVEDGTLFVHEVYNLNLNASLTVLSACDTGTGQLAGGEGILSFGRAFIHAGCPNLVMTLWTVDDRSSKEIMIGFYKSMIRGAAIAEALRESKLAYLDGTDQAHAHPHYWAGFIDLGQEKVLDLSARKPGKIFLFLFVICTITILVLIQIKRNPRRSGDIGKTESRKL